MNDEMSEKKKSEEIYHDTMHQKGFVQKGHLNVGDSSYYKYFYSLIGDVSNLDVLEVGCGGGWLGLLLAESANRVCGIDISGELIRSAKKEASTRGCTDNTFFAKMAVEDMDFEDDSFDVVIGSAILHHTSLAVALENIFRVLKPKGRAVFIEPLNENFLLKFWRRITPSRRSPMERALVKRDLELVQTVFPLAKFQYFGLLSIFSMGLIIYYPNNFFKMINRFLDIFDRHIFTRFRIIGPYCAVVVMELFKSEKRNA